VSENNFLRLAEQGSGCRLHMYVIFGRVFGYPGAVTGCDKKGSMYPVATGAGARRMIRKAFRSIKILHILSSIYLTTAERGATFRAQGATWWGEIGNEAE
jgi:hypothetical protein